MKKLLRMFLSAGLITLLAVAMTGCGDSDNDDDDYPAAPTGISAVFNNATSATVSWTPVANATSYNIYYSANPDFTLTTATGVTKISNVTTSPHRFDDVAFTVNTPYYFIVTAVNADGESAASLKVSAQYATFAQGDLTGTWYVTVFQTGAGGPDGFGWIRMTIPLDATGAVKTADAALCYQDSNGGSTWPTTGDPAVPIPLQFTIDPLENGIVRQVGFGGELSHNIMSSNKDLIIGTLSFSADTKQIRIFQRVQPGVVFNQADDLDGKSFVFHQLASGLTADGWRHGTGTISAASGTEGLVTINSFASDQTAVITPPTLPAAMDTLTLDANGVVTSTDLKFKGFMSSDISGNNKKLIVGTTTTAEGNYELTVIQITESETFTYGDLAGYYNFSSLFGGVPGGYFQYGTLKINSLGYTEFPNFNDNGTPDVDIDPITLDIDQDGTISQVADPSFHGTLSATKDLLVSTYTLEEEETALYGLSLAVK